MGDRIIDSLVGTAAAAVDERFVPTRSFLPRGGAPPPPPPEHSRFERFAENPPVLPPVAGAPHAQVPAGQPMPPTLAPASMAPHVPQAPGPRRMQSAEFQLPYDTYSPAEFQHFWGQYDTEMPVFNGFYPYGMAAAAAAPPFAEPQPVAKRERKPLAIKPPAKKFDARSTALDEASPFRRTGCFRLTGATVLRLSPNTAVDDTLLPARLLFFGSFTHASSTELHTGSRERPLAAAELETPRAAVRESEEQQLASALPAERASARSTTSEGSGETSRNGRLTPTPRQALGTATQETPMCKTAAPRGSFDKALRPQFTGEGAELAA